MNKPPGVVVHRGFSGADDHVLARLHREGLARLHPVHRLDRATSGVLLFACHRDAARALGEAFGAGAVEKRYLTMVRGTPKAPEGLIDHPVPRDEGGERVPATTRFRFMDTVVVAASPLREKSYSWVEAFPITGRFHQIRRHMKHIGHPLIGDTTYGRSEHNAFVRERFGLARLALHCARLRVELEGAARIDVTAPLAPDLEACARAMGFLGIE